jgi:hypothetical protein
MAAALAMTQTNQPELNEKTSAAILNTLPTNGGI